MARPVLQIGWLAKGLLFVVIGGLAIEIARRRSSGGADEDADQTGALQALAEVVAGRMLVAAMAVGLFAYAAWNLWSAAAAGHDGFIELASRIGRVGLAVVYALLAETALQIAIDGGPPPEQGDGGPTSPAGIAQRLFEVPAGRAAVVILGVGTAIVAAYHLWKGASGEFLDDIDLDGLHSRARAALRVIGTLGFVARATILAIAGWLFVDAAKRREADRAAGLDDALRSLRDAPLGTALLAAAGAGLVAAGLYDALTFRRQRFG